MKKKQKASPRKHKASPRGGKAKADKGGNQTGAGTTAVVAEAVEPLDEEETAGDDDRTLDSLLMSLAMLEEEKRLAGIRAAKEAKELAEEEECRKLWYDFVRNKHNDDVMIRMRCAIDIAVESISLRVSCLPDSQWNHELLGTNRDEEDAEELEAWRARREAEDALEISPKLSKEETVRLLTAQYDQALKQASWLL